MRKTRWAIVNMKTGQYVSNPRGGNGLAWTYSREEAEETAASIGGEVVDADEFKERWRQSIETGGPAVLTPTDDTEGSGT